MIRIPSVDSGLLADWAELYITYYNRNLSKSKFIKSVQLEFPEHDDDDVEAIVDGVFNELSNRLRHYNSFAPYSVSGNIITPNIKWHDFPEMTLCLIFSLYGVEKIKGSNDGTKYFEQVSNIAVKSFFSCETMILGFPNKRNFRQQILDFVTLSKENKGHRDPRAKDKDKGVDIIAWKSFDDDRSNQLIFLVQCGAGVHFGSKKPIDITGWRRLIDWAVDPITAISIPKLLTDSNEWEEVSNFYKIVLDRARITKAIYHSSYIDMVLRRQLKAWCRKRLT